MLDSRILTQLASSQGSNYLVGVMVKSRGLQFDEIGRWTEIKHDIIRRYGQEYVRILAQQRSLHSVYIDAFAGHGEALRKETKELVPGSPLIALELKPKFEEHHFIDIDGTKTGYLRKLTEGRSDVVIHEGDCNKVLKSEIFPTLEYESFRRALCLLDPKGLHLEWDVVQAAGELGTIDIILNFPVMDMNENALWRNPDAVPISQKERMTAFWGDETWMAAAYKEQPGLFGESFSMRQPMGVVVDAYRERLRAVAGFKNVTKPIPMRNSRNAIIYYLFFASQKKVAADIIDYIFRTYERGGFCE